MLQQKKEKAAMKLNQKPSTVTVVLLKDYSCIVPKSKSRLDILEYSTVRGEGLMQLKEGGGKPENSTKLRKGREKGKLKRESMRDMK